MSFNLQTLTEGIRERHVGTQNKRLLEKWSRTGLLRGMDDVNRENMATLLENQAAQLLREANTLGSGQGGSNVNGFTNIAFPIVRRVFGGLVANELVSIQPMSLPSGLLFYLDYTYGSDQGSSSVTGSKASPYSEGSSIYNNPVGRGVQSGSLATGGQYDLVGSDFSRRHVTAVNETAGGATEASLGVIATQGAGRWDLTDNEVGAYNADTEAVLNGTNVLNTTSQADLRALQFDSQIIDRITDPAILEKYTLLHLPLAKCSTAADATAHMNPFALQQADLSAVKSVALLMTSVNASGAQGSMIAVDEAVQGGKNLLNVRRLNQLGTWNTTTGKFTPNPFVKAGDPNAAIRFVIRTDGTTLAAEDMTSIRVSFVKGANLDATSDSSGSVLTVPSFESDFGNPEEGTGSPGNPQPVIPEIDIKIESLPVTAQTRKLRARWSPELAQDLNAYHSMDAEVELTQILSEQIALEIDREILNDLLTQAQGANFFWSRSPGKFVNKRTGQEIARTSSLRPGPAFTGTVREWYETLTETVIDVANEIHRKTLRGSANFIVVSPDVATILEASVLYRPSYSLDGDGQVGTPFTMGAEKVGTLSNRFTVYKDPYFPRNKILVGYKGGSYLETGFVYAPYVPLIVTPTIFQPEDFTPRKGVMTRYGKKMVRADFYGTVTCLDMNVI